MSNLLHRLLSQLSAILFWWPFRFLVAILKMAEYLVARDQNLMCVMYYKSEQIVKMPCLYQLKYFLTKQLQD